MASKKHNPVVKVMPYATVDLDAAGRWWIASGMDETVDPNDEDAVLESLAEAFAVHRKAAERSR